MDDGVASGAGLYAIRVTDTNLVISGEAPVIGVAGPGNMVMSVIRLYGSLDGGRDVRLKWPEN